MPWRWTNPDARPISEYLYDYHLARRAQRFLYYCRECIRNFDVSERVAKCPRCGNANVIELPKEAKLERRLGEAKKPALAQLKKGSAKAREELARMLAELELALWRTKIAIFYVAARIPDEMK